jgi:hypothetical protein
MMVLVARQAVLFVFDFFFVNPLSHTHAYTFSSCRSDNVLDDILIDKKNHYCFIRRHTLTIESERE